MVSTVGDATGPVEELEGVSRFCSVKSASASAKAESSRGDYTGSPSDNLLDSVEPGGVTGVTGRNRGHVRYFTDAGCTTRLIEESMTPFRSMEDKRPIW